MKIRRKTAPLYLRINASRAADLFLLDEKDHSRVNASLDVQLNDYKKRCRRKLNSSNPSWDATFDIPLNNGDCSDLLVLAVWNKSSKSSTYMGEVRMRVLDIFQGHDSFKTQPTWYKLHLSQSQHGYVTGSLLLLFELALKSLKKTEEPGNGPAVPLLNKAVPKLQVEAPTVLENSVVDLAVPTKQEQAFQAWTDSLLCPEAETPVLADEQGFYSNLPDMYQMSGASDVSDVETSVSDSKSPSSTRPPASTRASSKSVITTTSLSSSPPKFLPVLSGASDMSDSDMLSQASGKTTSDASIYNSDYNAPRSKDKIRRLRRRRRKHKSSKYELRNRNVEGVLFLEIALCSDLPPIKNFTRTTFDMDPFVVVTFGKKTFRTSWKRHKLNPIYNERLAFEVMEHELNYNIKFTVLDKDHFSFHDQVAEVALPVREILEIAKDKLPEKGLALPSLAQTLINENSSQVSLGSGSEYQSSNPVIELAEDGNIVRTRKKKFIRKKTTVLYVDTSLFKTLNLSLVLKDKKMAQKHSSSLKIRVRYLTYENLRRDFWKVLLEQYNPEDNLTLMDYIELISFLDTLGSVNSDDIVSDFFSALGRSTWGGDRLTNEEIVDSLETYVLNEKGDSDKKIFEIDRCPVCTQQRFSHKDDLDIITHVAICASKDWSIVNKLLVSSFVSQEIASRRWYSKLLIKLTYGKYQLGSNSANILVQDRSTGLVLEEKMNVTVRLGIRLLYKGLDRAKSKRIRILLQKLSVKQGVKFDHPSLKKDIQSFIDFHKLDMRDCLIQDASGFKTFNDFFYRKLRPGARPIEAPEDNRIAVSPADCRCITFETITNATELWIKGRNFTLAKLFNGNFNNLENTDLYKGEKTCIGIFRLAPQDYHRFHSPVKGTVGKAKYIEGEYYTVNPMAIRSDLDVYGENVRVIVPIHTEDFGTVILIGVGAMMVGSTVITVSEGQEIERGDEVGYFKFGGSTVLLLFQNDMFKFDLDLVNNSKQCTETLVRVGQSIGHAPETTEYKRKHIEFDKQPKDFKVSLIRAITGGDVDASGKMGSWESQNLSLNTNDADFVVEEEDLTRLATEMSSASLK